MNYSVILLAAGKGSRSQLDYNKVFYTFENDEVLIQKSATHFLEDDACKEIIITTTPQEIEKMRSLFTHSKVSFVFGGDTRQDSVLAALQSVQEDYVMIHDGARCFLSKNTIDACKETLSYADACVVMVACIDSMKRVVDHKVVETLDRETLYNAQTPQCFKTQLIKACYEQGKKEGFIASDDTTLVSTFSDCDIYVVKGEYTNIKVTTPKDLK